MTATDPFYHASGSSPPGEDPGASLVSPHSQPPRLPAELVDDLARLLANALIADIRQYPNLAELKAKHESRVESRSRLDRGNPPSRRPPAARHPCEGPSIGRPPSRAVSKRASRKSWPGHQRVGSSSATAKKIQELDKEAR